MYICDDISLNSFLKCEMFQIRVAEKIKTHFFGFSNLFFSFENHVIYEIMCKNIVEADRPQMTI
jgi:hypothetical protein